ncbi:hypothetical protein KPL71_014474 [Citrus sinensis]|uniref:Uncharacterized protein n=1 Tax=Citrus sinensis TaxID=2711 RepID=A0ACB8KBS4_CITSI|nr:hypothetical protein KPL71_014474 [Citrus sinensis]
MAKAIMDVYQIMQFQNQEGQRSTEDLAMQRWNPPPSNKLKVNVDVAIHEDRQVASQLRNNNIIHMANDRDRAIRDYAVLTPQAIHPEIVRPDVQADNFKLKPVIFQMPQNVGQFNSLPSEDPHLHLKLFLEVSDAFKITGASFYRQNQDNPYSNTYNPGWRQHPNFSWSYQNQSAAALSGQNKPAQAPRFYQQNQEQRSINNDQLSSLEALIKDYIVKNEAVVQNHAAPLRNLKNQIGQLATAVSNRPQGSLPSNTENPRREGKEHYKVINLRSGNEVDSAVSVQKRRIESNQGQEDTQVEESQSSTFRMQINTVLLQHLQKFIIQHLVLPINIPFVEALEQMPNYAKFFKDILTKKRRLREFETVALTQECSRMLQSKIPQKMKDLGSFTIPYSMGTKYSGKTLCDLGASINLMPLSVFKQLGVGERRPTTVTLQLADKSHAYPEGKIEDVLVKVDKFIFPVDFIVLDFEADKEVPIIQGRPFLATGNTLINVQKGELTMRVND